MEQGCACVDVEEKMCYDGLMIWRGGEEKCNCGGRVCVDLEK